MNSGLPLRWRVLAVVLFLVLLAAVNVAARVLVHALPTWLTDLALVGGLCFGAGWLAGERSSRPREIEQGRSGDWLE